RLARQLVARAQLARLDLGAQDGCELPVDRLGTPLVEGHAAIMGDGGDVASGKPVLPVVDRSYRITIHSQCSSQATPAPERPSRPARGGLTRIGGTGCGSCYPPSRRDGTD